MVCHLQFVVYSFDGVLEIVDIVVLFGLLRIVRDLEVIIRIKL